MAQESSKYWTINIFNQSKNSVSWLAERVQLSLSLLEKLRPSSTDTCLEGLTLPLSHQIF